MPLDAKAYLADMTAAANQVAAFTSGKTYADYLSNDLLRSAVERQFEILGEALRKLSELDPDMAAKIPEYRRIIAFRNVSAGMTRPSFWSKLTNHGKSPVARRQGAPVRVG